MTDGPLPFVPLLPRITRPGAVLWLIGPLQFVAAMIVVQLSWTHAHPYSLTGNYISDLGNTACGYFPSGSTTYICSPWHDVFNASVVVLGAFVLLGAALVRNAFKKRSTRAVGLGLVALAGVAAVLIGVFPENVNGTVHDFASAVAFVGGGVGVIVLSGAMAGDVRWTGFRAFSAAGGAVAVVASVLFEVGADLGLGVGGMERLVVAPLLLVPSVLSVHLLRLRSFAPHSIPGAKGT